MSELHVDPDKLIDPNEKEQLAKKFEDSLSMKTFALSSNTAFDDSSDWQDKVDSEKRNKIYKMQSKINGLSSKKNTGKSVAKSDSESSLDPWFHHIDVEHDFNDECTDPDEACQLNDNCGGIARRQGASNIGDSDSITEGPSQFREPRRRRKLKRMMVDPPIKTIKHDSAYFRKSRRSFEDKQLEKAHKLLVGGFYKATKVPSMSLTCGKRKREEEKTTNDFNRVCHRNLQEAIEILQSCPSYKSYSDKMTKKNVNEREFVLSTTDESDESREADDEQSDFFLEPGTSKRIVTSDKKNDVEKGKKRQMCSQERFLCNMLEKMRIPTTPALHAVVEQAYQKRKKEIRQHFENLEKEKALKKVSSKTSKSLLKSEPEQLKSEPEQPKSELQQPRNEPDNSREFIRGRRRLANAPKSEPEQLKSELQQPRNEPDNSREFI